VQQGANDLNSIFPVRPLTGNRLLTLLDEHTYGRLKPHLEPVDLPFGQSLAAPGGRMRHIHFVDSGLVSIFAELPDGRRAETVTIGQEGLLGMPGLLGGEAMPFRAVVQVSGHAHRISPPALNQLLAEHEDLRRVLRLYGHMHLMHVSQIAACNALHTIEQRAARWLLAAYDRMGAGFELTQQLLASMLGVRRPSISKVASTFQEQGAIRYSRGMIVVRDPQLLEQMSCCCYGTIRDEYARIAGMMSRRGGFNPSWNGANEVRARVASG
jgi:CRP-like cAMP-binding protein